jgi:hypothetical protein
MIKKILSRIQKIFPAGTPKAKTSSRMFSGRMAKYSLVMGFMAMFAVGFSATTIVRQLPVLQQCIAAVPGSAPSIIAPGTTDGTCSCCSTCFTPCSMIGTAAIISALLIASFLASLKASAVAVEIYANMIIDQMMYALLTRINESEMSIINWWKTFWYYNLLPAMQSQTRQLNTAMTDQSRTLQDAEDAGEQTRTELSLQKQSLEDQRTFRPSEDVCVAATNVGGHGRATAVTKAMQNAWQHEVRAKGDNNRNADGAGGALTANAQRYKEYQDTFCDPNSNDGHNTCGASTAEFYDADTQPQKFIFNKLTIDNMNDPRMALTVDTAINNIVGFPETELITVKALDSGPGQQFFLDRRSYLARYAAVRSVPQMVAGLRMPGSRMTQWVKDLRVGAGIPLAETSPNPSYKEVMHALSVDKFNSGMYAEGLITDQAQIELEKVSLNAFYLMQLRDYYELLERTALTLAVQVAMMSEAVPMPDVTRIKPLVP